MQYILDTVREYPQIIIFLALAIGYFVGKIKFFGFNLGSTAGVLLASLVLGQLNVTVTPLIKAVGFALFIFCIGYKVGPQFFGALRKEGIKYIWLSFFVAIIAIVTAIGLGRAFKFDKGTTAGLLGGALTQSSVIGTADGAIKHLAGIDDGTKSTLESNVAIAYAITYIFGVAGLIVFFKLVPKLMGVNLKTESEKLEKEMSGGEDLLSKSPELFSWSKRLDFRAYQVTHTGVIGKTVKELEGMFSTRIAVNRIKRDNNIIDEPDGSMTLESRDIVALVGNKGDFIDADSIIGPEVNDKAVVDLIGEILDICVLRGEVVGKTLGEISQTHGHGCFLRKITRQDHELPLTKNTVVHKCDVLQVTGSKTDVEKLVNYLGYPERPTVMTDLVMVGIGCVLGTLVGLLSVKIAGIPITLGIGGGVLVAGLIAGWLRSMHPTFGQIPSGAQWIMTDLGLNLFIACVGLTAAPKAFHAIQTTGSSIFIAGVILSLIPHIAGIFFGKIVLKLNPVLLLGALTGAGTVTPALNALKEDADSSAPALGYSVPYAFGNVLLTIGGTIIVNVL